MKKLCFVIVTIAIFSAVLGGCSKYSYNNTTEKDELITEVYPESICEQISYQMCYGSLHFDDLKKMVKLECLRKTDTGSYAILKLDNQKYEYIIFDENNMCTSLYQFQEKFPTRAELEGFLKTSPSFKETFARFPNAMISPTSAFKLVFFPVQEGYVFASFAYYPEPALEENLQMTEFYEDITDTPMDWFDTYSQILDIDRK